MRINHNISALNTYNKLGANQLNSSKNMEKLSSGLRINRAGDDAAGLAISEKMRAQVRGLDMATKNANDSISMIQTAEGALNETHSILQRMRELAVQATNDTNTDSDRSELQAEINQLISEIDRIGNTTEFNTKKLLDGSAQGVTTARDGSLVVNNNSRLQLSPSALETIKAVAAKNADVNGSFTIIKSEEVKGTEYAKGNVNVYRIYDNDGNEIKNAELTAYKSVTQAVELIGKIHDAGFTSAKGDSSKEILSNAMAALYTGTTNGLKSHGFDAAVNAIEAELKEFNQLKTSLVELEGYLQTAAGTGVKASGIISSLTATQWMLNGKSGKSGLNKGIQVLQENLDKLKAMNKSALVSSDVKAIASSKGAVLKGLDDALKTLPLPSCAQSSLLIALSARPEGKGGVAGKTIYTDISRENTAVRVSGNQIVFNAGTAFGSQKTSLKIDDLDKIDANGGMKVGESITMVFNEKVDAKANVDSAVLTQIGANGGQTAFLSMADMSARGLDIEKIQVGDKYTASAAIERVNAALSKVSAQRSALGAVQNRLEHTINNLTVASENLTSAESRIRDVDMAKEMMDLTKNNILSQAAQAMLAQANQTPQGVLQLLG